MASFPCLPILGDLEREQSKNIQGHVSILEYCMEKDQTEYGRDYLKRKVGS
jgi:hypothetical protein